MLSSRARSAVQALAYPERAPHRTVLFSVIVVLLASNLFGVPLIRAVRPEGGVQSVPGFLIAALSLELTLLAVVGLARFFRHDPWPGIPPIPPLRLPELLAIGLVAGPALFLVSAVVQLIMVSVFGMRQTQLEDFLWIRSLDGSEYLTLLTVVGVVAPVAEEAFFRGYVFRAYLHKHSSALAYVLSAGIFALLHMNVPAAPPIFAMGLVLAGVFQRTGSLLPCAVAHGFNNTAAFVLLYFAPIATLLG